VTPFSYTAEAWKALAKNPQDRGQGFAALTESLGGRFHNLYYCFGDYDGLVMYAADDDRSAAALVVAAITPGHLKATKTSRFEGQGPRNYEPASVTEKRARLAAATLADEQDSCPHRMACARCDFYVPKESTKGQLLEARSNLERMLLQIPLSDDERAAVEDGQLALDRLLARLADVPTPAGPTPRQLALRPLPVVNPPARPRGQRGR
jgi:uncharacterized protein with GYD domain